MPEQNAAKDLLRGVSSEALRERLVTKLKATVPAGSDVWLALDELVRRAKEGNGGR